MKRKLFTPILALGLILCLMAPAANAWEFEMDGVYTWLYETRGQQGTNGFFGAYDTAVDDGANTLLGAGAYAPYNFYTGGYYLGSLSGTTANAITRGASPTGGRPYVGGQIVSGSDASWGTMNMTTNMQIRMNPAVRIRGNYYIGSWHQPNNYTSAGRLTHFEYLQMEGHGAQRSFSPGYWRTLWLSAQLPWGEIAVGKRPSSWGMGLAFGGPDNRSSESLYLAVPYGPIRIGMGLYTSRDGYMTDDYGNPAAGFYNWQADKNNKRVFDMTVPQITYSQGPINAGAYVNWMFRHRGGEAVIRDPGTAGAGTAAAQRGTTQARDYSEWYGGAFFKYNNGRFFLNSEINTLQATDRRSGTFAQVNRAQMAWPTPVQTNHWSGALEAGVLAGPAKVSVLGSWMTGNDYRYAQNGLNNNAQQLALVESGLQPDAWSNTGVFRPYSYLMVYSYGLGTSFARDTGDGWVQDASFYGGRMDYAVAANLNIFGAFAWAEKFSKSGNLWGCLSPYTGDGAGTAATNTGDGSVVYQNIDYNLAGGNSRPTIPDTALGYEIDFGFDWKLLEALTARCTVGYWVPGKWWSFATVDKGQANWANARTGDLAGNGTWWGTNPGKTIDPIWGMEFKLEGTF